MLDAVKYYLRLCWFDAEPLYLVASKNFLKLNIVVYAIVQYFLQTNMTDDPFESFTEVILESVFIFIFVAVMLFFDKRLAIYVQVTTSILFCTNALSIFFVPIMVWLTVTEDPLSYYVMGILVLWFYALITYVIKTSLDINSIASIALSLLYFITVYLGAIGLGQLL